MHFVKVGQVFLNLAQVTHIEIEGEGSVMAYFATTATIEVGEGQEGVLFEGREAHALINYMGVVALSL